MKHKKTLSILVILISILSAIATSFGIFSNEGKGTYNYTSIRGQNVLIYGRGVYHHMSAEVAPQGIAQDVVTLFLAIPLLVISLLLARRGSKRGNLLLAGTLAYFLVTYLFFTMMAMYNQLFVLWVVLLSVSFYGFILSLSSLNADRPETVFSPQLPVKFIGGTLMLVSVLIALLWLSIVVPPMFASTIPVQTEHYTTLVVQALDLSILLPASFIAGWQIRKKTPLGYLLAPVYSIFLCLLMTALTAKILAMGMAGYNIIPAVFIIPVFNVLAIICAYKCLIYLPRQMNVVLK